MPKTPTEMKNAYAKKAYDDVRLQVKKGAKAILQDVAADNGLRLQTYIKEAIKQKYSTDTGRDIDL